MEAWSILLVGILFIIIVFLLLKIYLLRKSAREIIISFADRIDTETNTLIDISSRDRNMMSLADSINSQLRSLRSERHNFKSGDLELKEAMTNISHDLRTPLTAVLGYMELLDREEKSEQVVRYLEIIKSRCEIIRQLTDELFDYSVLISTSGNMEYIDVNINDILEESISAHYNDLKNRGIIPEISITENKINHRLNKNALSRIFGNIITNAIKYSDGDLIIKLSDEGSICFSNTASKLDEIKVGKLFNRFYTVETANKSTGLGLSIARSLTEQMGGTINAVYSDGMISVSIDFLSNFYVL